MRQDAFALAPCPDKEPDAPPPPTPRPAVQLRLGFDLGPLFDRQETAMKNKAMHRAITIGEALDVRKIGEDIGGGVYRLRAFTENVDYCDANTESWIWSIGRHKETGQYMAATDERFCRSTDYDCVWAR